jgi:zinc transport system ATP-binding protein
VTTPAVEYRNVTFTYPGPAGGGRPALERVSLIVNEGERLGVLGPNGGGKSTLVKLTLGLLSGHEGDIRVLGLSPHEAARRRLVGYVPQRPSCELGFPLTCRQVVTMPAGLAVPPWRPIPPEHLLAVDEALEAVGASDVADRPIGMVSGGQFQRVMIARALAARPRLLLLDEPAVGIDAAGQQQFAALLERLHARGLTVIVVSHDIRTVAAGCDRVACLSRTLHSHTAPQGLTPAVLAEVFRHDVAAVFGDLHVDAHAASACTDPAHTHPPMRPTIERRHEP